jgi:L-cysteine desulfidase
MDSRLLISLLKAEVIPAMGCTEPGAVALASAQAGKVLKKPIDSIEIIVNANIYKNGMAVGIPGTGSTGLEIAAALGAIKKQPEKQLSVLAAVSPEELTDALQLLSEGRIQITVDDDKSNLWICALIKAGSEWSRVIIADHHTNIISIEHNGEVIFSKLSDPARQAVDNRQVLRGSDITIAGLIAAVEQIPSQELTFLLDGVEMNLAAAQLGSARQLGMGIGHVFAEMQGQGIMADDIINYAKRLTAAAADVRMSGETVPIMSSAGSGNHGITVILPVYAVAERINCSKERLTQAIAISHLVTIYIKIHTGSLSALCGCAVAAATGASAAITWLLGEDIAKIQAAMKNVIANLTGMICDGGKVGCALKLSTAAATAVESALLAQRHIIVPSTNGIIAPTIEETICNLGKISNPGMVETDKIILKVMLAKGAQKSVS